MLLEFQRECGVDLKLHLVQFIYQSVEIFLIVIISSLTVLLVLYQAFVGSDQKHDSRNLVPFYHRSLIMQ